MKLKTSGYLFRTDSIPQFSEKVGKEEINRFKFLARLQVHDSKTHIDNFILSPLKEINEEVLKRSHFEKLWLVVKSLKLKSSNSGYLLAQGDVIRIGRCKFRIKELKVMAEAVLEGFSLCDMLSGEPESDESDADESTRNFNLPCRICLSESYADDNPLISPCNCGGTMKYIHLKCLQSFLKSKLTTKSSECVLSFSWKKLGCDLCKKTYPYKLMLKDKTIELLDIPKPPGQYMILEVLCCKENAFKGLHVIHMGNKNTIKIGRAQECELRITDISVSRNHAQINFFGGNFYLEDTGSKFGTLVQVKRPILLEENKDITMQSGRSLLTYTVKAPWTLIPSCFRSSGLGSNTLSSKKLPVLPINTGIPLSIDDPYILNSYTGVPIRQKEKYQNANNLLYEHNQLGANSSYEIENDQSIEECEEVEVAQEEVLLEETNRFDISQFRGEGSK